jgi:uncharacterized Zn finger protein (UPF0148 family)
VDAEKYSRTVALQCPTCGNSEFKFESEETNGPIECVSCNRVFTREELISENGENIEANLDEIKAAVAQDVKKEVSDMLRKAFSGSKYIKIR